MPRAVSRLLGLSLLICAPSAMAEEMREVSGTAGYLARIALPPSAEIAVEARGAGQESLALARRALEGAQVPVPFALNLPARTAAELFVALLADGQALWVSDPVAVAPGVEAVDLGEVRLRPFQPFGFGTEMVCGATRLRLGFAGDKALMATVGASVELAQERTASGARYVSPDGGTSVWTKGNTAIVEIDGAPLADCEVVPPDAPASWRARGNEPGWSLTLEGGRFTLVSNYGADSAEGMRLAPGIEGGAFVYDVAEIGARISVAEALCRDDMTGMPYPQTVTIETGGGSLRGCGGEAIDLLRGAEWAVEDIAGTGLIDSSRVTMVFGRDGGLHGSGGCNRYTGGIEIGGEAVSVGPVAATMMACPEALMTQERRFFEALERVDGFDIDATGALRLLSVGQPVLTARR